MRLVLADRLEIRGVVATEASRKYSLVTPKSRRRSAAGAAREVILQRSVPVPMAAVVARLRLLQEQVLTAAKLAVPVFRVAIIKAEAVAQEQVRMVISKAQLVLEKVATV